LTDPVRVMKEKLVDMGFSAFKLMGLSEDEIRKLYDKSMNEPGYKTVLPEIGNLNPERRRESLRKGFLRNPPAKF